MKKYVYILIILTILAGGYFLVQSDVMLPKNFEFTSPSFGFQLDEQQRASIEARVDEIQKEIDDTVNQENFDSIYVAGLYAQKGTDELMLGFLNDAHASYMKGLDFEPQYEHLYTRLFNFYNMTGETRLAKNAIEKAVATAPSNTNYRVWHIAFLEEKYNISSSRVSGMVAEALENVENKTDIHAFYAGHLERIGDIEGAVSQWENAIAEQPDNESIYRTEIQRLENLLK